MNQYIMFYLQTSTVPLRMHHKLTKHGRFCEQNNQLPTKTHVELTDNSIEVKGYLGVLNLKVWSRNNVSQYQPVMP